MLVCVQGCRTTCVARLQYIRAGAVAVALLERYCVALYVGLTL